ncbi:hypothetical protein [Peribacillus sp. NPDC055009]
MLVVSACGNDLKGNGKTTELGLEKSKKFETGFLYVRSPFESRNEEENFNIKEIERVAEAKNINLNIYHAKEDTSKLGLRYNPKLVEKRIGNNLINEVAKGTKILLSHFLSYHRSKYSYYVLFN